MNWKTRLIQIRTSIIQYTGWILFFYAITHLLNHALGILGLGPLEQGRLIFIGFWRFGVLEWLVISSAVLHFLMVLHKLFFKKTFRGLHRAEWIQIILGFLIAVTLTHHIMETKIASELFDVTDSYTYYLYWSPGYSIWIFISTLIIIWWHGTIGMRYFLQQKSWYSQWSVWLSGLAVGLPILAIAGIVNAQQEVDRLAQDESWSQMLQIQSNPQGVDLYQWEESWTYTFTGLYVLFVLIFFAIRKVLWYLNKRHRGIDVKYLEGTVVKMMPGASLLEASLQARIPHAHVCGGRGRCSTCRVEIITGMEHLPPPSPAESELLARIRGSHSMRLACQTRPHKSVTVHPLLLPNVSLNQSLWDKKNYSGTDCDVAILFADLRGFTSMSENKLPYDVVFVLNQYFQFMGHAVESQGGRIDKFIGDAIMAVFGHDCPLAVACQQSIAAARSMRLQLDRLNNQLKDELSVPLSMGFGIHCGRVIIGEMGYKDSLNLVAIGDATNTASRLEGLTKEYACELIISEDAAHQSGILVNNLERHEREIRGRQKSMAFYVVKEVKSLQNMTNLQEVSGKTG